MEINANVVIWTQKGGTAFVTHSDISVSRRMKQPTLIITSLLKKSVGKCIKVIRTCNMIQLLAI